MKLAAGFAAPDGVATAVATHVATWWTPIVLILFGLALFVALVTAVRQLVFRIRLGRSKRLGLAALAAVETVALILTVAAVAGPVRPARASSQPVAMAQTSPVTSRSALSRAIRSPIVATKETGPGEQTKGYLGRIKLGANGHFPRNTSTTTGETYSVVISKPATLDLPQTVTKIYVPPGYTPADHHYPVLYLFSGSPHGLGINWFATVHIASVMDTLIGAKKMPPTIVVGADQVANGTDDSECLNHAGSVGQVETEFVKVLVPWVDAHLATIEKPTGRAIGGFSSGAFCAVNLTLRHQRTFGSLLALGAYYGSDLPFADVNGHYPSARSITPHEYLPTMRFEHPVPAYFGVGTLEPERPDVTQTRWLAAEMKRRGQPVELVQNAHFQHSWAFVRHVIPGALEFVGKHLASG